ncbi:MFS transporter [Vibrio breoganii]|uniref:MFS transporter n=1 Tax=Vibrio breoganii TaxID=553239 RepID=UPI000C81DA8E|nr:MFS transporter [Vibrio breoganii]PMO31342.1 transporter [Vibrio breoganii]
MSLTRNHYLALGGILLLAANLRGPFTSLAPLLDQIMVELHLSSTILGMLSSLPLLSFALISPLALTVLTRFGLKKSVCLALFSIFLGVCLRSVGSVATLYVGTVFIGAGIAIGNVLLPVAVKMNFPTRIAVMTSLYTFTMGIGSTLSSASMVPLSHLAVTPLSGWQFALLFNLFFVTLALVFWFRSKETENHNAQHKGVSIKQLLSSGIAWQVTLALGLNSFTFYSFASWLPKILLDQGMTETEAGYIYGLLQFATIWPGLVLIPFLSRLKSTQALFLLTATGTVAATLGLIWLPDFAIFWTLMFGFCNCSTFVIGLSFVGLRSNNASQAAALSAMSQSFGYGFATIGPPLLGYLHQATGNWTASLFVIAIVGGFCALFGALSARDVKIHLTT